MKQAGNGCVYAHAGLKDYDTQRDKRFSGSVRLPHVPRAKSKVKANLLTLIKMLLVSISV